MTETRGGRIDLGLDRIRKLLQSLDNPFKGLKIIHIAGTNGKGSVCAFMASVLIASGYKTGQFNSPHFLVPSDSILINAKPFESFNLVHDLVEKKSVDQKLDCTPFEIMTATALLIFQMEKVDIALLEVGLGGRLDATNVIDAPIIAVITSISFDHMEFLGNTIKDIATEKSGIIKNGISTVIIAKQEYDQVYQVLRLVASKCGNCPVS